MSRLSVQEALDRGFITTQQAKEMRSTSRKAARTRKPTQNTPESNTPQGILWRAVHARWPTRAEWEYPGAIPERKFRLDIAFPCEKLCVEVDGWEWHGKHLSDFKKDREKQNLLTLNGWRILRFTASNIRGDLDSVLSAIHQALSA